MHIETVRFQPNTTADDLLARLRARLFDGSFAPGETVSIRRIAQAEEVSVIPARDALRGLVAEGALEFRDARTIVVPVLDDATLDELRYGRLSLEAELAERAFAQLADAHAELAALDDDVSAAILARDLAAYMQTNRAFHFRIYRAARAPVLQKLAESMWLRIGPSLRIVCDAYAGLLPASDYHQLAIAALRAGDRFAFRKAIEADIAQGIDEIARHIKRSPNVHEEKGHAT